MHQVKERLCLPHPKVEKHEEHFDFLFFSDSTGKDRDIYGMIGSVEQSEKDVPHRVIAQEAVPDAI